MDSASREEIIRRAILDALYAHVPRILESQGPAETLRWMQQVGYSAIFVFLVRERFGQLSGYYAAQELSILKHLERILTRIMKVRQRKRDLWPPA